MSREALTAFEELLVQQGVVDAVQWRENLSSDEDPSVDQVYAYLKGALPTEDPHVIGLLAQIPQLIARYPSKSDEEGSIRSSVVPIEDPVSFKATLRSSRPPMPIVEWADLPVARF